MNALQHEIEATYQRTLSVIAEAKLKSHVIGFVEGFAAAIGIVAIYFLVRVG